MYSAPFFPEIVRAASSAKQFFKLIDQEEIMREAIEGGDKPVSFFLFLCLIHNLFQEIQGNISLFKVDFAYPSRPDLLVSRQLSISVKKGQSIALVGASGCGKSTTIALLERFYLANSGQVVSKFCSFTDVFFVNLPLFAVTGRF